MDSTEHQQYTSAEGAQVAAGQLAHHVIGRNPKIWGVVCIGMAVVIVILIIVIIVAVSKYRECHAAQENLVGSPYSNLTTGSNNPQWQNQMGDAGWGGSLQSTYQPGQPRVWGASADGGHTMQAEPQQEPLSCAQGTSKSNSYAAAGEARALEAAQAYDPNTHSSVDDDALVRVLNGGKA